MATGANVSSHVAPEVFQRLGIPPPSGAWRMGPALIPTTKNHAPNRVRYALPYHTMWRGNHNRYEYNKNQTARWGEGETKHQYHQYFSHAKCPNDYRSARDFEYIGVARGKMVKKPLPTVQYVKPDSKPKWLFKSWNQSLVSYEMWQREVMYPEHVPEHLKAKRPLAVLSPVIQINGLQLAHMQKITVTISPFLFGFGHTMQKAVMDFYRRAIAVSSPFPEDRIALFYNVDVTTPEIVVTWANGSTWRVPIMEGVSSKALVQTVMEKAWLMGDVLDASGQVLEPIIDDYKWDQLLQLRKKKKAAAASAAAGAKGGKK